MESCLLNEKRRLFGLLPAVFGFGCLALIPLSSLPVSLSVSQPLVHIGTPAALWPPGSSFLLSLAELDGTIGEVSLVPLTTIQNRSYTCKSCVRL